MWTFILVSTIAWGIAEIFYKKGNLPNEKYSHLKVTVFVGIFMGIYATVSLFVGGVNLKAFPRNFIRYLPVAICYIMSMVCSYFGVRFLMESISDPIENTSAALVPILCAIFLKEKLDLPVIIGISVITLGLICISIFDKKEKDNREKKYGKKIAIFAIIMPFCYLILDAVGTFLDIFYVEDATNTVLVGVNDLNIENTANCAYEFTFFLVAIGILIFLKAKGEKLFSIENEVNEGVVSKIKTQKWKILAAVFETIGQATYLFALSDGSGIAAVILGAGTVIVSVILSRVFLKEKLSILQYCSVAIIIGGIVLLSVI